MYVEVTLANAGAGLPVLDSVARLPFASWLQQSRHVASTVCVFSKTSPLAHLSWVKEREQGNRWLFDKLLCLPKCPSEKFCLFAKQNDRKGKLLGLNMLPTVEHKPFPCCTHFLLWMSSSNKGQSQKASWFTDFSPLQLEIYSPARETGLCRNPRCWGNSVTLLGPVLLGMFWILACRRF